ncbi:MAG: hypothetical protein ACN6OR_05410, partial [Stenotrophomonas sp.]
FIGGACFVEISGRHDSGVLLIEYDDEGNRLKLPARARGAMAQASAEDVVDVPSAAEGVTAPLAAAEAEGDAPVVEAAAEEVEAKRAVKKAAKKVSTKKSIPA